MGFYSDKMTRFILKTDHPHPADLLTDIMGAAVFYARTTVSSKGQMPNGTIPLEVDAPQKSEGAEWVRKSVLEHGFEIISEEEY